MEELLELREHIEQGRYMEALAAIDEMEEMSRDDKINKIESLMEILLIHLIKRNAEKRLTRSWEVSIHNAVHKINLTNKRRKAGGSYLSDAELKEALEEAWQVALPRASLETFEGRYDIDELAGMVDKEQLLDQVLELISGIPTPL